LYIAALGWLIVEKRLYIFGASGSGTTTLGLLIAQRLNISHFDTDDYFWLKTDTPFTEKREVTERQTMLKADLDRYSKWVLSGSLCGWGDFTIPYFSLVVFLHLPAEIRLQRLKEREIRRYGTEAISSGGWFYQHSKDFMEWAARYDTGDLSVRSLQLHEKWLEKISCPILRLDSQATPEKLTESVEAALRK
jgi:adenylate kinase family enzyme